MSAIETTEERAEAVELLAGFALRFRLGFCALLAFILGPLSLVLGTSSDWWNVAVIGALLAVTFYAGLPFVTSLREADGR